MSRVATYSNRKAIETPPLEIFKTQLDNAFNNPFCSWSWPHLEQAVGTETSRVPFQPWSFYNKCQNAPISLDIVLFHRHHSPYTCKLLLIWDRKDFVLGVIALMWMLLTACCQDWRNRRFKLLLSYRHCYVFGQILYPCWIISEQLQLGTRHITTLLNTSDSCAFSPFLPQARLLSLNWHVTHWQYLPEAADSPVKIARLLRVAFSNKICCTSPDFQEMRALP